MKTINQAFLREADVNAHAVFAGRKPERDQWLQSRAVKNWIVEEFKHSLHAPQRIFK